MSREIEVRHSGRILHPVSVGLGIPEAGAPRFILHNLFRLFVPTFAEVRSSKREREKFIFFFPKANVTVVGKALVFRFKQLLIGFAALLSLRVWANEGG